MFWREEKSWKVKKKENSPLQNDLFALLFPATPGSCVETATVTLGWWVTWWRPARQGEALGNLEAAPPAPALHRGQGQVCSGTAAWVHPHPSFLGIWALLGFCNTQQRRKQSQAKYVCFLPAAGMTKKKMHVLCQHCIFLLFLAVDEERDCPQNRMSGVHASGPHYVKK